MSDDAPAVPESPPGKAPEAPAEPSPPKGADPSPPGEGLAEFIAALAEKLPGRSIQVSVRVSPEAGRGGGGPPINPDGTVVPVTQNAEGQPGTAHPGTTAGTVLVVVATPVDSQPGPLVPPTAGATFLGSRVLAPPLPTVPGVELSPGKWLLSVYSLAPGGRIFWAWLPAGSVVWVSGV